MKKIEKNAKNRRKKETIGKIKIKAKKDIIMITTIGVITILEAGHPEGFYSFSNKLCSGSRFFEII